ncbi:toxic anion resistance protein [Anaeropeptidivorans aminofermentans]|jgi:uncharacterized protein YaaN involved in tellurite resistance|uniref:toxic anion resistance protein n=1 Tax=Anaeropeptidivorans aminofermentans TaxID=2934315 RepID=UPI0020241B89|nr:toxic anion resistance protein [Anaeropeptidivorans aminofermentans]MBE6011491.1 toxic anion resistance protein [Lachnospiraceae bacterium]
MEEIKLELSPGPELVPNTLNSIEKEAKTESNALSFEGLTEEEKNAVKEFSTKIDITNSSQIITYGASAQNKIAQFSDSVLRNVKTKDLGEAGKLISNLVVEIQNFDATGEEKKGFFSFLSGAKKTMDRMVANFNKAETNIDKISDNLENHRRQLLKDIELYDLMFENNYVYFKELNLYIVAGKEKLREINEEVIPALRAKAEASGDEVDAQKLNDMINAANRFEKKIHDLMLSRTISLQMAPQIRLLQNNDAQLADKIQSSIVNSIPLWKNQMVIALGLANSKAALETQKKVTETTNELLRKNSEMLKQGSLEVAKESEEGIVSIDTIKKTNQDLIDTINGILEIQEKGRQDRIAAEAELYNIEQELKQALLATKAQN